MRRKPGLFFLLMLIFCAPAFGQSDKLSSTNARAVMIYQKSLQLARDREFDKAIEQMNAVIKRDPRFGEAYLRLGGFYATLGDKAKAYEHAKKGISLLPFSQSYSSDYLNVAELAMSRGEYDVAEEHYTNYLKSNPKNTKNIPFVELLIKDCKFAREAIKKPVNFNPQRMSNQINQFAYQYFPTVTADQRFFLYTGRGANSDSDENLYIAERINDRWDSPAPVSAQINTQFNEGAGTISGDGKTLVFASCERPDSYGDCDLYISTKQGNQWSKPRNMGQVVNSTAWDSQPSLSADGRTLYFSSERRNGSMGQQDLWVTRLQENGGWSTAQNLGPTINTSGKEMSPFIHTSGSTLYFASDGHVGMGGLDVFETNLTGNAWTTPENLGYPLNTFEDEGSIYITANNTKGYYSRRITNPNSGKSSIDLYEFGVPEAWRSKETTTYAAGRVFDAVTKTPIKADVQLYNLASDELVQQVSSDGINGEYTIVLNEGSQYAMYASADNYLLKSLSFDYTGKKDFNPLTLDIYLDPVKSGSSIVLNNLFFESGKFSLENKSKTEIKKLVAFLRRNNTVTVEISGHTDDIGSDNANLQLSEKRAQSVANYLVSNGIRKDRIRYVGYGETKPAVPNNSEANRQQNRRIEFRIL